MFNKLLNHFGYYKIKDLTYNCHCGICGKPLKKILPKETDGWDLCNKCRR
jgi:hypothetical protein